MGALEKFLRGVGLSRPELRAWAMYDCAVSAVQTTIMVAVFPIFYIKVAGAEVAAAKASQWYATSGGIAIAIVAVLSPILGVIADRTAARKRLLAGSMTVGILACAAMYFVEPGDLLLASVLFVLTGIGAAASTVFYDALLPHIAADSEVDRVSATGFATGYLGGGILLALNLAMIGRPEWFFPADADPTLPMRVAFLTVAVWWLVFSIPLFRRVPEPPLQLEVSPGAGRAVFGQLLETFRDLRRYKTAFLMLVALLIYNDGISTIGKMATAYGTELGIGRESLISAILLVQFLGIPATLLFGAVGARIGAKRAIFAGLVVYCAISIFGYFVQTATHFYVLAVMVAMVQGGTQALSRSLFASLIPRHQSAEFFGFYSVFNKFAGVLGPIVFAGAIGATGSSRNALLAVIGFFIVGGVVLAFVNVEKGERAARAAERAATPAVTLA